MEELAAEATQRFRQIVEDLTLLSNSLPYADGIRVEKLFDKFNEYDRLQEERIRRASHANR